MAASPNPTPSLQAALAAHRFGLGESDLSAIAPDPIGWLRAQIGPADTQIGARLPNLGDALAVQIESRRRATPAGATDLRALVQGDIRARLVTAASTPRPFAERLALFWANHFTVSLGKGSTTGLVGAYEREAIRPHIAGRFADLLSAAVTHPAMLRYLDNTVSAGPQSPIVLQQQRRVALAQSRAAEAAASAGTPAPPTAPRITGLNENLAREVLELHTLGVAGGGGRYGPWGGYTQADVTGLAAVLTGWRGPRPSDAAPDAGRGDTFDPLWHQPGPKTVLGRAYTEGPQALRQVLDGLAGHPSTARFIATKLARHFVADKPPLSLVNRLAQRFSETGGDLSAVYLELIDAPEAWASAPAKLKTPEEFVVSAARLLRLGERVALRAADAGLTALGQRPQAATSPAGWPDAASEWLGPEAVWQRIEWSVQVADRLGMAVDARALAASSLGPLLGDATRLQIDRAADAPQALALLLMAPEFQRR